MIFIFPLVPYFFDTADPMEPKNNHLFQNALSPFLLKFVSQVLLFQFQMLQKYEYDYISYHLYGSNIIFSPVLSVTRQTLVVHGSKYKKRFSKPL